MQAFEVDVDPRQQGSLVNEWGPYVREFLDDTMDHHLLWKADKSIQATRR